jgi:molecular chaperone DnaK
LSDPIVGIDLGTSNSVVAHADATGNVKVLADDGGYKIHPSVVSFHPNGGVVVGAAAKQRKVIDPQNTIYSIKRLIGRAFSSPEVTTARQRSPFQIKEGANQLPLIVTRGGEFAVPEISAIVLDHVRNIAVSRLEQPVSRAVVTVPASFNDAQRSATATAGAIAGLTVVRVLNEPTAAALAYGHARNLNATIAVYDFGGGTFDITILKLADQVYEVLGTSGDTFLGGDDLDERLVDKMVTKFLAENRIDLRSNEVSMMRLRAVAEQTKIELSRRSRAVVRVDEIAYGAKGVPLNLQIEISRDEFVSQVADIIDRTFPVCKEALSFAQLGIDKIDDVILVGGTTKIPYVRDQVSKFFAKAPRTDVNPEDAVAVGAALQATALERILSRRTSSKISVPAPRAAADEEPTTDTGLSDVLELIEQDGTGATMAPSELSLSSRPKRQTAGYSAEAAQRAATESTKPDTSYSVSRAGTREVFEERTPAPGAPPASPTQPIGRIKPPPAVPPSSRTTTFGVPAAPMPEGPRYDSRPVAPPPTPTSRGAAPLQRPVVTPTTQPGVRVAPPPPAPAATGWGEHDDFETQPAWEPPSSPAATQPMAPAVPIAPATAPTLMAMAPPVGHAPAAASTARGTAVAEPLLDLAPASTAKGFEPPQTFPVLAQQQQPPRAAPIVMEVTPRSLGIATVAGYCEELIRRNSRLPTEMRKVFTTSRDRQDMVRIVVCQGESRRLDNNTVIGDLLLENLPARPRGETSIEVTFSVDAAGILQVTARDALTGTEQRAELDLVGGVREQDVAAARDRIQQLRR